MIQNELEQRKKRQQRVQPLKTKFYLLVPEIRQNNSVKNIIQHLPILDKLPLYWCGCLKIVGTRKMSVNVLS